ncbi:hypothetical protein LCGC14_0356360 [marine sediment metagenome]|uniref:Uncharacterized protein n=1 Tax=marine sediment metagenome TaxID=412755 RepID=A0A0F9TF77_9ZZZZ
MPARRSNMAYHIAEQVADGDGVKAGRVFEREIEISSAEIKLLVSAPKELVPAPGPGKVIEFVSAVLFLDYNSTTYDTNTSLTVQTITGNTALSGAVTATNFLHKTADAYTVMQVLSTVAGVVTDVNDGIELVAIGIPATGNSPMKIKVSYRVHDFN